MKMLEKSMLACTLAFSLVMAAWGGEAKLIPGSETSLPKLVSADGTVHVLGKKPYPVGTRAKFIASGRALAQAPESLGLRRKALKGSADNRSNLPPIGDQDNLGSCVHWAGAYYTKSTAMKIKDPTLDLTQARNQCSPTFTYNLTSGNADNGGYGHEPFEIAMRYGVASKAQFFIANNYSTLPDVDDFVEGLHRRSTNYVWLWEWEPTAGQISELKAWLDTGAVAACGIYADTSFDNWSSGDAPWVGSTSDVYNNINHMVTVCGYGDGYYLIANSWGSSWGSNGCIVVDADYFENYVADIMYPLEGTYEEPTEYATVQIDHSRRSDIRNISFSLNGTTVREFAPLPKQLPEEVPDSDYGAEYPYLTDTRSGWKMAVDLSDSSWDARNNTMVVNVQDNVSGTSGSLTNFAIRFQGETYSSTDTPVAIPDNSTAGASATVAIELSGVRFAPMLDQTATAGSAFSYDVVATNISLEHTGAVSISVTGVTPAVDYTFTDNRLTFTPEATTYVFSFCATNTTDAIGANATLTVDATLAAPQNPAAPSIDSSGFTATWDAVSGATSYFLEVVEGTSGGGLVLSNDFSGVSSGSAEITDFSAVGLEGWSGIKIFPEDGRIKGGSSGSAGELITPTANMSGTVTVTFDAQAYGSDTTTLNVGISTDGGSTYTDEPVALSGTATPYSVTLIGGASACVHFKSSAASKQRFYLDNVVITASGVRSASRADGDVAFAQNVGDVTSYAVTGLQPNTAYFFDVSAVRGTYTGLVSSAVNVETPDGPSAPAWSEIPAQSAIAGEVFSLDLAAYLTGSPTPTLTLTSGDATISGTSISFTPADAQTYTFGIQATNDSGSADATLTVTATLSAPVAAEATVVGSDSFTANWAAVAGADSYFLQVTEGTGGGGGGGGGEGGVVVSNDFSGITVSNSTAITDFSAVGLTGWSGSTIFPNSGMVKGGSSGNAGELITPTVDMSGTVTVTFDAQAFGNDTTTLNVGISTDGGSTYTDEAVTLSRTITGYSVTLTGGASACVHFESSAASKQRFYLDNVVITASGVAASGASRAVGDIVFAQNVGAVTSYAVTGLSPLTQYSYVVAAIGGSTTSEWSGAISLTTSDGPSAPAFSASFPSTAAAYVGMPYTLDVASYVTGSPTPVITKTSGDGSFDGTRFTFTPPTASESETFTFSASNENGTASASLTLNISDAPPATKYAVCVGINEYEEISSLRGCVNDATYFYTNLVERGDWPAANITKLTDSQATKNGIRTAISNCIARARAGDTFVYQHSSHGGNENENPPYTTSVYLCVYDEDYYDNTTAYNDYELAADLQSFAAGVKVVVIVDACHSGGLFKSARAAREAAANFDLAGRVTAIMNANRAARIARGDKAVAKSLAASEIGWVTAANYTESSLDGGDYGSDLWLTDGSIETVDIEGGVFLACATWGEWSGAADTTGVGNNDGYADGYELWKYAYTFCTNLDTFWNVSGYSFTPQYTNEAVLRSVPLGWVGDEPPSGVRFGPMLDQTATAGTAFSFDVVATNSSDEFTGDVSIEVSGVTPAVDYTFTDNRLTFTPEATAYVFSFCATNTTDAIGANATLAVDASLAAPQNPAASTIGSTGFTATWDAVAGATSYFLEVIEGIGSAGVVISNDFSGVSSESTAEITDFSAVGLEGWSGIKIFPANGKIRCGAGSTAGELITPTVDMSGTVTVTFDAQAYGSDTTTLNVGISTDGGSTYTDEPVALSSTATPYSVTLIGGASACVHFKSSAASKQRFYLDNVVITASGVRSAAPRADGDIAVAQNVGNVTTYAVTGLQPNTAYHFDVSAVRGAYTGLVSSAVTVDTTDGPAAPAWDTIPEQTATVGQPFSLDLAAFVSGSPTPTLTLTSGDATITGTMLSFTPGDEQTYTFGLQATNDSGTASATLTVVATIGPVVIPTLTLSGATADGFTASWTACTGVSTYTLQVATNDFAAPSSAPRAAGDLITLLNPGNADLTTVSPAWTYEGGASFATASGGYQKLCGTDPAVVSPSFDASGVTNLVVAASSRTYGGADANAYQVDYRIGSGDWTQAGEITGLTSSFVSGSVDVSAAAGNSSVQIRMRCAAATTGIGVRLQGITVKGGEGTGGSAYVTNVQVSATSFAVTGLASNTLYYARVKGTGDWSVVQSITTTGGGTPEPGEPIDIPAFTEGANGTFGFDLGTLPASAIVELWAADHVEGSDWVWTPLTEGWSNVNGVVTITPVEGEAMKIYRLGNPAE